MFVEIKLFNEFSLREHTTRVVCRSIAAGGCDPGAVFDVFIGYYGFVAITHTESNSSAMTCVAG